MEEKIGYRDILHQKEYMKTVIAAIINRFGDSIDSIAFTWLVYQLTQSAAWSAVVFGVNRVPTIFLQPFAGAVVEGRNKKRIMIITDIIRGICVGIVATCFLLGLLNQWILLACTFTISCAEAFRIPASNAMLPKLLEEKYYTFGISFSASVCSIMELIGFGMAGVIIAAFSISTAIYIDMITFFLSAAIILTLRLKEELLTKAKINAMEYISGLKAGFVYLKEKALLRYFVILAVFLNAVLVPMSSLQAPLVSEVLHSNEIMLSILSLSITIGMIIGAVAYPYISAALSQRAIICIGGYGIAAFYIGIVASGQFLHRAGVVMIAAAFASLVLGFTVALANTFANVEFMKTVDQNYIARVSAIMSASCGAAMPVVSLIIGAVTAFIPTRNIFLVSGLLDIIICLKLCSRKKFAMIKSEQIERTENGREIADSGAC